MNWRSKIEATAEARKWALDHEKLDVYQVAIEFVVLADEIVENLPRGRAYLSDQLHRAALSIALNIAKGAGEYAIEEKARFYRIDFLHNPSLRARVRARAGARNVLLC